MTPPPVAAKKAGAAKKTPAKKAVKTPAKNTAEAAATDLLVRAIRVGLQKSDDDWVYAAGAKSQMQRMDPSRSARNRG